MGKHIWHARKIFVHVKTNFVCSMCMEKSVCMDKSVFMDKSVCMEKCVYRKMCVHEQTPQNKR